MKYFITTFGCQMNHADSERISADFTNRGLKKAKNYQDANYVIVNSCMVRESAENRVYGLINNLGVIKNKKIAEGKVYKIIVTGCMTGVAMNDKTSKYLKRLREKLPHVDEFLPISEVGYSNQTIRQNKTQAWVNISNGCNNFCSYCIVPFSRGREISRPYKEIIKECKELKSKGYKTITLLGQNVNSYGSDIVIARSANDEARPPSLRSGVSGRAIPQSIKPTNNCQTLTGLLRFARNDKQLSSQKPVYVKHLGKYRIPTLFPYLLEDVAKIGFEKIEFMSSNPWDFSDELIKVIARNKNISRTIHLPVQSGDDNVLKRMNRWYSANEYLKLIANLKSKILNLKLTTDIIVGFCGETDEEFENTVNLCRKVGFEIAFIGRYSPRPFTFATKTMKDDVLPTVKKKRWLILENLINKPHLMNRVHLK